MNDTKGSNEKKELSFAEKMKIANSKEEQEQEKAREVLENFKKTIEERKEQCIEAFIDAKCKDIKKSIETKVVAGNIIKKKKKKIVVTYMKMDMIPLNMTQSFKDLIPQIKCLYKNTWDYDIKEKILPKELPAFIRNNELFVKPAFGGFRGIFFQRFNKFTVEISKQIIERLEKDGIKFAGIVKKGKWESYKDKRPVTKKINGVLPLLYDGEFDLKFILEL